MSLHYKILRSRVMDLFPAVWNGRSQTDPVTATIHGINFAQTLYYVNNRNGTAFHLESDWDTVESFFKNRIITDTTYIPTIYKKQKIESQKLVALAKKLKEQNFEAFTLQKLFETYTQIENAWLTYDRLNVLPWYVGADPLQQYINDELQKSGVPESDKVTLLTLPELSFSSKEELLLLKLALMVVDSADHAVFSEQVNLGVEELVADYSWIPFGYDGPLLYDEEHYKNAIKNLIESKTRVEIVERINALEIYEQSMLDTKKKLIKQYGLSQQIQELLVSMDMLTKMTDERKETEYQIHVTFDTLLEALAKKMLLKKVDLKYLQFVELQEHATDPQYLTTLAQERMTKPVLMVWENGVGRFLSDHEIKKITVDLFDETREEKSEIYGNVGSKGESSIVRGRVTILLTPKEIPRLQEGDVLVTHMTSPEFVPAMRKSIAIVTDEGGVTCHAAVISREINKPCIIGTKNATKILRDGDLVEVDAERGIVSILEHENKTL